jgi:ketosteroid isomerase-like protein
MTTHVLSRTALAVLFLALPLGGCATTTTSTTAVQAIDARNRQFEANTRARDLERLLREYYADGAVVAFGGPQQPRGMEAAREVWRGMLEKGSIRLDTERLEVSCDLASEMGRWTLAVEPEPHDFRDEHGEYFVTWKRIGGEWKVVMQLFNPEGFHEAE